jgi:hypothetical protein
MDLIVRKTDSYRALTVCLLTAINNPIPAVGFTSSAYIILLAQYPTSRGERAFLG